MKERHYQLMAGMSIHVSASEMQSVCKMPYDAVVQFISTELVTAKLKNSDQSLLINNELKTYPLSSVWYGLELRNLTKQYVNVAMLFWDSDEWMQEKQPEPPEQSEPKDPYLQAFLRLAKAFEVYNETIAR